jgi:two-component system OmpR family response regulator
MRTNDFPCGILLVERDAFSGHAFGEAVKAAAGLHVHVCQSGWQALALAPCLMPDLILLDANMPGLDGPATLRMLRRLPLLAHTAAIFMVGPGVTPVPAWNAMHSVLGTITRPADPLMLLAHVRQLWEGKPVRAG